MKIVILLARLILGGIFVVFGLNYFYPFLEMPELNEKAGAFMGAMAGTGYLTVVKICEIVGGALVLLGRYIGVGLSLLGPIIVNILLFHIFLAPGDMIMGVALVALETFLIWAHWDKFKSVFSA